ncbi:hypothetical protein FGD67_05295 [Colwellia sp. M166]|nr:hypothetical protein FGD67_05295 [Colwellia sp. M166]|tara:strand:- start:6752 stop:7024 length:273 start_codon:yes stop_codon:yes gene_type:complete
MYAQFSMADKLPDVKHALNFQKCLILGNYMMLISFVIISLSITINFVFDDYFTMPLQIFAHIATIVFAAALKLGYVLRCVALHGFGKKDF